MAYKKQVCQEIEVPEPHQICNGQSAETDINVRISDEFLDGKEKISIDLEIAPGMEERV